MWWALIKFLLDKNGSPAWNRISNAIGSFSSGKSLWQKYQPQTQGE